MTGDPIASWLLSNGVHPFDAVLALGITYGIALFGGVLGGRRSRWDR